MGRIGYTYGSEWHLLRLLAYHRNEFSRYVETAVPGGRLLGWLDHTYVGTDPGPPDPGCYPSAQGHARRPPRPRKLDEELKGIDFLDPYCLSRLTQAWLGCWPQGGNVPNWDAVGQVDVLGTTHWLLVEAKSHAKELESTCGASENGGLEMILVAFEQTARSINTNIDVKRWLGPYYQFANRLAVLDFLRRQGIPAIGLFVYFLGDRFPEGDPAVCPATRKEWEDPLAVMYAHIGWTNAARNTLKPLMRRAFIPVHGIEP